MEYLLEEFVSFSFADTCGLTKDELKKLALFIAMVHDIDKGIGTEMMNALIEYARNNNYNEITGDLSVVDADHKDRLHHFYRKFGFEITEFDSVINNYYGCIAMKL